MMSPSQLLPVRVLQLENSIPLRCVDGDLSTNAFRTAELFMTEDKGGDSLPKSNLRDVDCFATDYDSSELLGSGRFGAVHKVTHKASSEVFAGKFCSCGRPSQRKDLELEVELMSELQFENLVRLREAFIGKKEAVLVMELISGGELFDRVIDPSFQLTEEVAGKCLRQICAGVGYMHSKSILHLDLKPENIMCSNPDDIDHLKIVDFGLARRYCPNKQLKVMFGTPEFVAPEVVNFDPLGPGTDMWSVGVITYVLLSGLSPFMGDNEMETLANVTACEWDFEDDCFNEISDSAKDFVEKLLAPREKERPHCEQCLQHPWLSATPQPVSSATPPKNLSAAVKHLKEFVSRRKWARSINAVRALGRLQKGSLFALQQ